MKKFRFTSFLFTILITLLFSFVFFSCASKPAPETEVEQTIEAPSENIENVEKETSEENQEETSTEKSENENNEYEIDELDEIEVIAHDKEIDFDSAKHILDDEKMNKALQLIRKFYVYIGARLERENAMKILESDDPKAVLDSFHFYDRYIGLIENERQLAKFNEKKTFVFLGSGPLPLTLIMFRMVTGCKCIGIEQQEDVANLSRNVNIDLYNHFEDTLLKALVEIFECDKHWTF